MGTLLWKTLNNHVHLRARSLLGRHPQCDIRVDVPMVSGEHVRLNWTGNGWELRDLGSRNGTYVAGRRLEAGERVVLDVGTTFSLTRRAAEFELVDASAPGAMVIEESTGKTFFSEGGVLALPNAENPLVSILNTSDGEWLIECGDVYRRAVNHEILDIDGTKYRLELPLGESETIESIANAMQLESIGLRLAVTPDEEKVEVTVFVAGQPKRLPERHFHYLLVTLARAWIADEGASHSMRGWVDRDELCSGLGIDEMKLNVEIYRCRKQLAALGIQGAAGLIERRSGTHQVRIGVSNVKVEKL